MGWEPLSERRSGPTPLWWVIVGVNVALFIAFWLPWVQLAPAEKQQANYAWIARFVPGPEGGAVQTLLDSLEVPAEGRELIQLLDAGGWQELRLIIAARRSVGGGWLLVSPFAAPWRLCVVAQLLLMGAAAVWCMAGAQERRFQPTPATALLIFIILATLAQIMGLPKLDTLGHDDDLALALVMAMALARPGIGFWLTLIGNTLLAGSLVVYLGLQDPAWYRISRNSSSFYEEGMI